MTTPADLLALGSSRYVSVTTVRKSGETVATPVWVARDTGGTDGDGLVVVTGADSGKVKRIRNNPQVVLSPCRASGKVAPGAPRVEAKAYVVGRYADFPREAGLMQKKYGVQFRLFMLIERFRARKHGPSLVIVRLTD